MENREIRELFLMSDRQTPIQKEKKQQVYERAAEELEKRRFPVERQSDLLFSQFQYMDKSFFLIYGVLVFIGTILIFLLQKTGAGRNEIIMTCMIGAAVLGISTVLMIDKLFFGRMAELEASCYLNTKQLVAVYMVIAGSFNLIILLFAIFYVGSHWKIGILQIGLYVLTSLLLSNIIALEILSTEAGRKNPYFLLISCILLSIGYAMLSSVPEIFYMTLLGAWATAFVILGILFGAQVRRLFVQMEKGEVLCMN